MYSKKDFNNKIVHRFTENAHMRFRPLNYQNYQTEPQKKTFTNTVSSIFSGIFNKDNFKFKASIKDKGRSMNRNKSTIIHRSPNQSINEDKLNASAIDQSYMSKNSSVAGFSNISNTEHIDGNMLTEISQDHNICFLEKVSAQTYLIGNQYQLDLISITGIYENRMDTQLNWSFSLPKRMKKVTVDMKKQFIAILMEDEIHVYRYNTRKIKTQPVYVSKIKTVEEPEFLLFLKDTIFGVFYKTHLIVNQIEETNYIRQIFNKSYGVAQNFILMQVPPPSENNLNIFFKEPSSTARIHTLWRLQFDLRNITSYQTFKSLMRIYDIPNKLINDLKISNYSKDTFIINFKFQILAAKDGYIMDSANINYEKDQSYLIHHGDYMLLITDTKMEIYSFKIATNVKPNKIIIKSQDSIQMQYQEAYKFINCLEMFNGNFLLFYQIRPQNNRKAKGEIDYLITTTQKLTVSQKLNEIFNFRSPQHLRAMAINRYEQIESKCDIAFKIGLSRKDVFLELWNRSGKTQIDDFKFLLDTLDYEVIKQEIEKKLKKCSMQFREVYKLEQYCLEMLHKQTFGTTPSQNSIKNYIKSHFFLRKLQFFRDKHALNINFRSSTVEEKALTIDIQSYVNCVNMELKSYFLELAFKLSFQNKEVHEELRLFMKSFRFPLRIIYKQILEDLIIQSKHKLLNFLKDIPEILPYKHIELSDQEDIAYYIGLHADILPEEWAKNQYHNNVETIYNRQLLETFEKSVWFKRYQYSVHDLIPLSEEEIKDIQQYNASSNIFYFFIEKLFEHCPNQQHIEDVVAFLESNYEELPPHLNGRIFLYHKLYHYFNQEDESSGVCQGFANFLKKQDFQLFNDLFQYQKIKKGCLLKDAKAIYSQIADGNTIYNYSLLNYFMSDLSEISDLKCILNRLNNEKRQFHIQNEGIYQVLVKGMQNKLKLGSDNDIPLDEVMIYVENIPLTKNNPIIDELQTIQKINEEAERFKAIKINMSFLEIMEKEETVITALIDEEIKKKNVMEINNEEDFIMATYQILAEIQIVKEKIYKQKFRDLQYFLYLNKLLEHEHMIKYAKCVLNDPHLAAEYVVDEIIIENLILFMYKWRLEEQVYVDHKSYVDELVLILPEENAIRKYIEAESAFAVMMSNSDRPVEYPLAVADEQTNTLSTVKLSQIQALFKRLDVQFILNLDLLKLHSYIKEMELFYQEQIIKLEDIYQITIKRLLELKAIPKAIPLIRTLIIIRGEDQNYAAIFCYLILNIIINEIPTEVHRRNFSKIAFYTFSRPLDLLAIIESRLQQTLTNDQEGEFFSQHLDRVRRENKCYSPDNILLDKDVLAKVNEMEERFRGAFEEAIFRSWDQVTSSRNDFSQFEFTSAFIFLLHNPYALSKYITSNKQNINLRILRSYISYIFKEQIFDKMNILLFGKRTFLIALENCITQIPVQYIASQYKGVDLSEEQEVVLEDHPESQFQQKLIKSIKAFDHKLQTFKRKPQTVDDQVVKKAKVEDILSRQGSGMLQKSQYPFNDSDDNYESAEEDDPVPTKKSRFKGEKKPLREEKNLALFLSTCGEQDGMRKTSPKMLKTSLSFHNQFQSLHFSRAMERPKPRKKSDVIQKDIHIKHTDSVAGVSGDLGNIQLIESIKPKPQKDTIEQDLMYISLEEKRSSNAYSGIKVPSLQHNTSPPSQSPTVSPPKKGIISKQSIVKMEGLEEDFGEEVIKSMEIPEIQVPEVKSMEIEEEEEFNIKVTVNQIDDEDYTPPNKLVKQLLDDVDSEEKEPVFNLSLLQNQKQKDFGSFQAYLKKIIFQIYQNSGKPLSILLKLIEDIRKEYPELGIQENFLKIYTSLENYNIKYRYNLPIRQMFPIEAIFLKESDIKSLFQFVKENILSYVDFDTIMVVAKVVHFSFQKSDIKDELYYSYLNHAIMEFGSEEVQSQEELMMQKQRIGGIIEQIVLVNMFVERGVELLESIEVKTRRRQIADLIKEAIRKKKKNALIGQFQAAIQSCL